MTRAHFQQFYVEPDHVHGNYFVLSGGEFSHAVKVLRKNKGDAISAVDGCGHLFEGVIQSIESGLLKVEILSKKLNAGEPNLFLTLVQAVPKGAGFDYVIEKGTEIGLSAFQPVITERSIIEPGNRIDRWKKKALTAMKQCGRSRCPDVYAPIEFKEALSRYRQDLLMIAHESYTNDQADYTVKISQAKRIALLIGPEGGFTEQEFKLALNNGAKPMTLGPRRLRSDTAGLVGAIKILDAAGEL
ncbi:16S rRNA (uracil(1498)-N(3))-methyltransferase [candidate division KSB1 bacterium]|nr:16S rRNA (uracil(1498)-N(3))-methyltransferase [candidate division KSB1 bacterium]